MKKLFLNSLVLLFISIMTACGGSGGGAPQNPPPDPDAFSLSSLKSLSSSQTLSFPSMTGSDTDLNNYSASLSISNGVSVTLLNPANGSSISATPIESNVSLTNETSMGTTKSRGVSYYAAGYSLVVTVSYDESGTPILTCTPDTFSAPPDFVHVSDAGSLANLTCNDGSSVVITWIVEAGATSNEAKFVIVESSSNGGVPVKTEEYRYIINKAGYISGIEVSVYDESTGVTVNLSGDRT